MLLRPLRQDLHGPVAVELWLQGTHADVITRCDEGKDDLFGAMVGRFLA